MKDIPVIISACIKSDMPAILEIERACFKAPYTPRMFEEMLNNPAVIFIKAETGNTLIGYVSIEIILDEAQILNIAVAEAHRGCGIAKQLLNGALSQVAARGAGQVFLEVDEKNFPAINLYKTHGFKKISSRPKYYGEDAAIIMKLII